MQSVIQDKTREKESLDLSECICNSRKETVVIAAVEKKTEGKHYQ